MTLSATAFTQLPWSNSQSITSPVSCAAQAKSTFHENEIRRYFLTTTLRAHHTAYSSRLFRIKLRIRYIASTKGIKRLSTALDENISSEQSDITGSHNRSILIPMLNRTFPWVLCVARWKGKRGSLEQYDSSHWKAITAVQLHYCSSLIPGHRSRTP